MKRVGLYGGTYDPPHVGQLMVAESVREQCRLDEIWFIPTAIPPHKERPDLVSIDDRLEMLTVATRSNPHFSVSDIEKERGGRSYTIDTIKQLKKAHPTIEFFFIIGGDMVESLSTWVSIDELLELITFIGVSRPGANPNDVYKDKVWHVEFAQIDLSSTMIRERIAQGKSIRYLVPDEVITIIEESGYYR